MRAYMISNTRFGHRRNERRSHETFLRYFTKELVPFLEHYGRKGDVFVHAGGLFEGPTAVNIDVATDIRNAYARIAKCMPVYFLPNKMDMTRKGNNTGIILDGIAEIVTTPKTIGELQLLPEGKGKHLVVPDNVEISPWYNRVYVGSTEYKKSNSVVSIGSPYPFDYSDVGGMLILDMDKDEHIRVKNNTSPRFVNVVISSEEDMKSIDQQTVAEHNVTAIIKTKNFRDSVGKIDMFLAKNRFYQVLMDDDDDYVEDRRVDAVDPTDAVYECIGDDEELKDAFDRIVSISQKGTK